MEGYFLVIDLLGFKNIILNSTEDYLQHRIEEWIKLVNNAANSYRIERIQLISDTVFAAMGSNTNDLKALIGFSRFLLEEGIKKSLPIRGAISYGTYEWGRLTYGKALVRAHEIESSQKWIGVTYNGFPNVDESLWGCESLVCYPSPMKSGFIKLYPVIAWNVPSLNELCKYLTKYGLAKKDENMTWNWAEIVNNTVVFGTYLRILSSLGDSGKKFHGILPIETIEMNLGGFMKQKELNIQKTTSK